MKKNRVHCDVLFIWAEILIKMRDWEEEKSFCPIKSSLVLFVSSLPFPSSFLMVDWDCIQVESGRQQALEKSVYNEGKQVKHT